MRLKLICRVFIVFTFSAATHASEKIKTILPQFEKYIQDVQSEWGAPGVSVAIVKDGQIVYIKSFGVKEVNTEKKIDNDTAYQIASLTKNIFIHVFAKLVEEKKIHWDDPVRKYLPAFFINDEVTSQAFTMRDLLSHRSGLPSFSGDTLWYLGMTPNEIIQGVSKIKSKHPKATKYGYQNQLFGVASQIVEKITGETFDALCKRYFFTPLEMVTANVGYDNFYPKKRFLSSVFGEDEKNIAYPHDDQKDTAHKMPASDLIYRFPGSSGVNMSILDAAKWMTFLLNNAKSDSIKVADTEIRELRTALVTHEPKPMDQQFPSDRYQSVGYGMGHFVMTYGEGETKIQTLGHMGGFYGGRSLMVFAPEEKLGIVILSNYGSFRVSFIPEILHNKFMDLYLGLSNIDWNRRLRDNFLSIRKQNMMYKKMQRLQHPKPVRTLSDYEGNFTNEIYGDLSLKVKSGQLQLNMRGKEIPLDHFNGDEFIFKGQLLSDAFCESDVGYIDFGGRNGKDIDLCSISSLLFEGSDHGLFEKKKA